MAKKVLVAMSGGVDSSVVAALLKDKGYDVLGLTMKVVPCASRQLTSSPKSCCNAEGIRDAARVARRIKIPHYVVDVSKEFNKRVIKDFVKKYSCGETPNPCVQCNKFIKFGELFKIARRFGAQYIATGHYARTGFDKKSRRWFLSKARDNSKDQSYVLHCVAYDKLKNIMFPLGSVPKKTVKKIARAKRFGLVHKEESQEICFIPGDNYREFLKANIKGVAKKGTIVDFKGNIVGKHDGTAFYTIGQRKGLNISGTNPFYVAEINAKKNVIKVGTEKALYHKKMLVKNINWLAKEKNRFDAEVKIRYKHIAAKAKVRTLKDDKAEIVFNCPQKAITPGQSAVFYNGDKVIGGGLITKVC